MKHQICLRHHDILRLETSPKTAGSAEHSPPWQVVCVWFFARRLTSDYQWLRCLRTDLTYKGHTTTPLQRNHKKWNDFLAPEFFGHAKFRFFLRNHHMFQDSWILYFFGWVQIPQNKKAGSHQSSNLQHQRWRIDRFFPTKAHLGWSILIDRTQEG